MEQIEAKKTVLYDEHVKHGGKIVEFGGFLLPVEYTGITPEHLAVRNECGLFDVSHMGEILVTGDDAIKFIDHMITSDVLNAPYMRMTYGLFLYPNGGVVDDLMVYKYTDNYCLLVVNASNTDKDFAWLKSHKRGYSVKIENKSNIYGQLALQGPKAVDILRSLTTYNIDKMTLFDFFEFEIASMGFLVSRSGYTGSDGFEIYGSNDDIVKLFKIFADEKKVTLCGLGCRDTLRFEAAMPLYGHEISQDITPVEAGLNYAICLDKKFIGSRVLKKQKENGPSRKSVGLELLDKGIARAEYEVVDSDKVIGVVTTGYMIPGTTTCYACALIDSKYAKIGNIVYVKVRKNLVKAKVRNKKFLDKKYIR